MRKLIIVLILVALFFGCKNDASSSSTTKTYTVTIDPNGGTLEQKTYTVEEGKTFTLSPEPKPAVAYYKVKDYINTADNSPFTMGTSAVNGDITLKVEWVVDLYVVRDMLTKDGGHWRESSTGVQELNFRKINEPSLDVQYDYIITLKSYIDQETIIAESDRTDMIAKLILLPTTIDYLKVISDKTLTVFSSSVSGGAEFTESTYTKLPQ